MDIKTDLEQIDLNEILVLVPRAQINKIFTGRSGIETLQIGTRKSNKSYTCYDKHLERKRARKPYSEGSTITRLECRLQRRMPNFFDLAELDNPFAHVQIFDCTEVSNVSPDMKNFVDACRVRGPNNALMKHTISNRRKYRKALEAVSEPNWWKEWHRKNIWKSWKTELSKFQL